MSSLARLFSLVLVSTFFLLPGSVAALSGEANAMCKPYIAECPCNQVLNTWRFLPGQPKCKAGGEKNGAGYSNTHACKVGVCKDITNEHVTQGVCIAAGKCEGVYADGEPVKKTDVPVKDGDKPVTAEPPPPPSVSDTGDVTGGMPQKPEVPETTVQDPTKDLQESPSDETPVPSGSAKSVEDQLKEAAGEPSLWERWFGGETTPKPETPAQPDAPVGLDGQPVQTLQPDAVADPQLSDTGVVQPQQGEPTHTFGQPEETKTAPAEDATWWGAVKDTASELWRDTKAIAANVRDTVADAFTAEPSTGPSIGEIEMPPPPAEVPTFADAELKGTPIASAQGPDTATVKEVIGAEPVPYLAETQDAGFGRDLLGERLDELKGIVRDNNARIDAGNQELKAQKAALDTEYAQLNSACAARSCSQSQVDAFRARERAYTNKSKEIERLAKDTKAYANSANAIADTLNKPTDLSAFTGRVPDTPENKFVSDVSKAALGHIANQEVASFWNGTPAESGLADERARIAGNAFDAATHNVTPSQVADAFGDNARLADIRNQTAVAAAQEQLRQIREITNSDTPLSDGQILNQLTPEQAELVYKEPLIREELAKLERESQSRAERTRDIQNALRNSQYGQALARALTTEPKTPAEILKQNALYAAVTTLSRGADGAELLRNTDQSQTPAGLTPEDYYIPIDTQNNVYTERMAEADRLIGELTDVLPPSQRTLDLNNRINGNEMFGQRLRRAVGDYANYAAGLVPKGLEALGVNSTAAHVANSLLNPVAVVAAAYDGLLTLAGNPSTDRMISEFGMSPGERTFATVMDYAAISVVAAPVRGLAGLRAGTEAGVLAESSRAFNISDSVATNAPRVELAARDFGAGKFKHVGDTPLGPVFARDPLPSVASRVTSAERQAIESVSGRSLTTTDRTILSSAGLEARPYGTVQAEISRGAGVTQVTERVNIQRTALVNGNGEVVDRLRRM
ncbi:MAG: hypothetical protein Athens041674_752 [Parcubacteria group bacterium Athens0416_74]|nr:MAG: hypothetical protein Athens041674_752 [Parcubacteria group bacterium Athens0416_74]